MTATLLAEDKQVGGAETPPTCYVCEEKIKDLGGSYHIAEGLYRHINCNPVEKSKPEKKTATPEKPFTWWHVKTKTAKNLKAIRDILSNHEYTFRDFGIVITDYDIGIINAELGGRKTVEDRDKRLTYICHYWVTACVKALKIQRGEKVSLFVEGCRNFRSLYEKALKRTWKVKTKEEELADRIVAYVKGKVTIGRSQLTKRFKISSKEVTKLLRGAVENGEVKHTGACYYV